MAILKPATASSGEEDSLSPPGTEDESRCTEEVRAAEESAGSGSEIEFEVSVKNNKTALRRWRERTPARELEQEFRAACSFLPYDGSRGRCRG